MKKAVIIGIFAIYVGFLPAGSWAQSPTLSPSPSDFDLTLEAEGISEADVETDVEVESLPGDGLGYQLGQWGFELRRALTFKADKKAALDRLRLHILDRKMAACGEIGDEKCVEILETRIENLQARAEQHLERRQELKEQWLERFQEWRDRRATRLEEFRVKASQRKDQLQELRQERQNKRHEVKEQRKKRGEQHQEQLKERRQTVIERHKKRLDTTRHEVKVHGERLQAHTETVSE